MNVLISAYACEPYKGSEPGVGWNWVKQIARFHEVWVITRVNNREIIEQALKKEQIPNVRWVYFDLPYWMRFWKKRQRGVHLYYHLWQAGAYLSGRQLHKEVGFDVVHHVTFVNYWMPGFLAFLPVPFVWGPVGGGESSPKAFFRTFCFRGKVYEYLRSLARWFGEQNPFTRLTAKRARIALATTLETETRLRHLGCRSTNIFSVSALTGDEITQLKDTPLHNSIPFRLLSIGRLIHWKGFHLGLMAFARFQREFPKSEYWFIGDGPERQNLESMAQKFSVRDKVRFLGNLPRPRVLEKLAECDALVHPSLHDSGGWVCLEAMASGQPVICLDLGGPATQVTEETGFKILAETPEQAVHDMSEAMLRLARDPNLGKRIGKAGRWRVKEYFDWDKKGDWINEVYQEVIRK